MITIRCISVFQHPAIFVQVIPFTVAVLSPGIGQISAIFLLKLPANIDWLPALVYARTKVFLVGNSSSLAIPDTVFIYMVAIWGISICYHIGSDIKVIPLAICIFNPGCSGIMTIFKDIMPALFILLPARHIFGFFTSCVYINTIWCNGILQAEAVFIQVILLIIQTQPSILYKCTIWLTIHPFSILICSPSRSHSSFISTGIRAVYIDQIFFNL